MGGTWMVGSEVSGIEQAKVMTNSRMGINQIFNFVGRVIQFSWLQMDDKAASFVFPDG
jgi:hypothetical protein